MNGLTHHSARAAMLAAGLLIVAGALAKNDSRATGNAAKNNASPLAYSPDPITTTSRPLSGKLFYSDEKRAQLDNARKGGIRIVDDVVIRRSTVLNGFVQRNDGSATYWVNGGGRSETRHVKAPPDGVAASSSMVGTEPKFMLAGSNVGAEGAAAGAKDKVKVKAAKKTTAKKNKAAALKSKTSTR